MRSADEMEVPRTTFNNWFYGYNVPSGEALVAMFVYFGREFQQDVLDGFTGNAASEAEQENVVLKKLIAELHERAGNGGFVKVEG